MYTKGKWILDGGTNKKGDLFIWKAGEYYGGHAIATVHGEIQEGAEANAARICQCVNSHDALVEACKDLALLFPEADLDSLDASDFCVNNFDAMVEALEDMLMKDRACYTIAIVEKVRIALKQAKEI